MSENTTAVDLGAGEAPEGAGVRKLSELRVIDLRAELKKRNLDISGNKSILSERLKRVNLTKQMLCMMSKCSLYQSISMWLC